MILLCLLVITVAAILYIIAWGECGDLTITWDAFAPAVKVCVLALAAPALLFAIVYGLQYYITH